MAVQPIPKPKQANPSPLPRSYLIRNAIDAFRRRVKAQIGKSMLSVELHSRRLARRFYGYVIGSSATLLSVVITAVLLTLGDFHEAKASETHLAAAQIIGAALALVLSLSIIPAQRAAELFSISILKLFAKDRTLIGVFIILVAATMISLLLGSQWINGLSARISLSIQFVVLGVSLDALRHFYVATLDLLAPESAIRRLVHDSKKHLASIGRVADKLVAIQVAADGPSKVDSALHAQMVTATNLPKNLQHWAAQLEEFAHRFISRRDSNATIEAIDALETLAFEYAQLRKKSITLQIDSEFPFAGPQSDVSEVLNPAYESIHHIIEDAISFKNARIVQHAIDSMGRMTLHAMTLITDGAGGHKIAPLAFGASFYFDRAVKAALAANMSDATLRAIAKLNSILRTIPAEVDLTGLIEQANETLFAIVLDGYAKSNQISVFRSIETMLQASMFEIESGKFEPESLRSLLRRIIQIIPLEVSADLAGKRRLQPFPAYDLGFDASIPMLLQAVALNVHSDKEDAWRDPFDELSEMMEVVRDHYRNLSNLDFQGALLRKWAVDSLGAILRVLFHQLILPPEGTEQFVSTVEGDLRPQITWMSGLFPSSSPASKHHVADATAHLTVLGIEALDNGRPTIALTCAETLQSIAVNLQGSVNAYELADIHVDLEILARASDFVGEAKIAADVRAMIAYPPNLTQQAQQYHTQARRTRFTQLDDAVARAGRRPYRINEDPVERLRELLATKTRA